MVVVACNSSSSHALTTLQKSFKLPIIGVIQPGARKAVALTRNNRIGVIATPATIKSLSYVQHLKKLRPQVRVINQACPLFVPLVEEGWYQKSVTVAVAKEYLSSIRKGRADTVILGCTHYPLLKPVLQKICGPKVVLVDSAAEVARNVKDLLDQKGWAHPVKQRGRHRFLVSDEPRHFQNLARRFLGYNIRDVKKVMPES
jgi:glutamate racemase